MTSEGRQIANLMMDTGKSAADMTHAVKILGDGSMQKGFARIGEFFSKEVAMETAKGRATGRIQGGVAGILGVLAIEGIIAGIIAYANHRKEKKAEHSAEGQIILKTLETETASESSISAPVETETYNGKEV